MINSDELIIMFICLLSKFCFKNVLYVKKKNFKKLNVVVYNCFLL